MNVERGEHLHCALVAIVAAMLSKGADIEGICGEAIQALLIASHDDEIACDSIDAILEVKEFVVCAKNLIQQLITPH